MDLGIIGVDLSDFSKEDYGHGAGGEEKMAPVGVLKVTKPEK